MPTQPPVSSSDIARLVTEVLRRIRAEADERQTENARNLPSAITTVSDRVIAAETIVKLAPGTKVVHVERKAVITPSARDLARDRGIELVPTKPDTRQAAGSHLFLAQAECTTDVSAAVSTIRRAVSTSQQLPSSGLATTLESLAEHAGRDAARCILLTENTAVACVAANRFPAVRAILGSDAATVADSIAPGAMQTWSSSTHGNFQRQPGTDCQEPYNPNRKAARNTFRRTNRQQPWQLQLPDAVKPHHIKKQHHENRTNNRKHHAHGGPPHHAWRALTACCASSSGRS